MREPTFLLHTGMCVYTRICVYVHILYVCMHYIHVRAPMLHLHTQARILRYIQNHVVSVHICICLLRIEAKILFDLFSVYMCMLVATDAVIMCGLLTHKIHTQTDRATQYHVTGSIQCLCVYTGCHRCADHVWPPHTHIYTYAHTQMHTHTHTHTHIQSNIL